MLKQIIVKASLLNAFLVTLSLLSLFGTSYNVCAVEAQGVNRQVLKEEALEGITEGKYKMRATEITVEPGGSMSEHTHGGPGMRYMLSGTLTSTEDGQNKTYTVGQGFSETPQVHHSYKNEGKDPVKIVVFELLPMGEVKAMAAQEKKGVTSKVMIEKDVEGLTAGKYKMILVRVKFAPGGYVGEHTHPGPGIRLLASGSLTITTDKTEAYKEGDYYFEPAGTHMAKVEADKSKETDFVLFEVRPADK
jgi:quercetin dioxygenase-like cupin family protein